VLKRKKINSGFIFVPIVFIVAIVIVVGIFIYQKNTQSKNTPITNPTGTIYITPTETVQPTTSENAVKKTPTPTKKLTSTPTTKPNSSNTESNPTATNQPNNNTVTNTPTPEPTATPTPSPTTALTFPSVVVTSSKSRGAVLSPDEIFSVEANYYNLPKTGEKGCNTNNQVEIELVYLGTQLTATFADSYSYPWTLYPVGEPKVYLAYVGCGTNAKILITYQVVHFPYQTINPYVTGVIAEYGTPNTISSDKYEFSW